MLSSIAMVADPIEDAFPIMVAAAHRNCRGRGSAESHCFQYHRLWPYKRLIHQPGSVWRHGARFIEAFRACARAGDARRVLISGSADYSLFAHILHAYRAEGVAPEVTVLDICETPLVINRWYAERHHAEVTTVACGIFDYRSDLPFDVVVADNFFRQFSPPDRPRIIERWWELLRPDGYMIATQSVTNAPPAEGRVYSPDDIAKRRIDAMQEAEARRDDLGISLEELGTYVEEYCRSYVSYSISSVEELRSLYETNGFRLERCDNLTAEGRPRRPRLDSDRKRGDRLFVVARRAELPGHRAPDP